MARISESDFLRLTRGQPARKSKYNAKRVSVDGISFPSALEADFYCRLKLLVRAGQITGFCRQARFVATEGDKDTKATEYVCDFIIFNNDGTYDIIDTKGMETPLFKLKMKCLKEKYPKLIIKIER